MKSKFVLNVFVQQLKKILRDDLREPSKVSKHNVRKQLNLNRPILVPKWSYFQIQYRIGITLECHVAVSYLGDSLVQRRLSNINKYIEKKLLEENLINFISQVFTTSELTYTMEKPLWVNKISTVSKSL